PGTRGTWRERYRAAFAGHRYPPALIALIVLGVTGAAVLGYQLASVRVPTAAAPARHLTVNNPYATGGVWYSGNLHVASVRGLGRDLPSSICCWYSDHGLTLVGHSDANMF